MRVLLPPLIALSALGLLLSIAAHLLALTGRVPPGGSLVMALHVGIFVVWIPTVLLSTRVFKGGNRAEFWKVMLSGCPAWMRYALYGLIAYAVLNMLVFVTVMGHGEVHYHSGPVTAETVRGFSGHWMLFYGAALGCLVSVYRSPQLLKERKCPAGHAVSHGDAFCTTCGRALGDS